MARASRAAAAATCSTQPVFGRRGPARMRASSRAGGGVLGPRGREDLGRGSKSSGLAIVELLPQACEPPGEVAPGRPWLASDQLRAFVERVAVFVVERHPGALLG